ncbi:MAG: hypothetical protein J5803_00995 [Desulfovibrio sp.]|nr:hypothetical protein [Desulfovibrio sp.]
MGEGQKRRTIRKILTVLVCAFVLFCPGCRAYKNSQIRHNTGLVSEKPTLNAGLPRVSPAFTQWLMRQSMLGCAEDLIAQVSGSSRVWQQSGTGSRFGLLLKEAPTWLALHPSFFPHNHPIFKTFANDTILERLAAYGIHGLFVAPTGETSELWTNKKSQSSQGEDIVSFTFTPQAGSDNDFATFLSQTTAHAIQIGGMLPPAATGFGPDCMLQLRGQHGYEGLYAAIDVPKAFWNRLPDCASEWDVKEISETARSFLVQEGILPFALHKDRLPFANHHGWAATGSILGIDGNERRFIYSYDGDVLRPILSWQDPSGHAKRLYAAACIRHTGLQQHALTGLSFKALMGLDAQGETDKTNDLAALQEPALGAFQEVGQAIHRYGGWSVSLDNIPIESIPFILPYVDFVRFAPLDAALQKAKRADTEPVKAILALLARRIIPCERIATGLFTQEMNAPFKEQSYSPKKAKKHFFPLLSRSACQACFFFLNRQLMHLLENKTKQLALRRPKILFTFSVLVRTITLQKGSCSNLFPPLVALSFSPHVFPMENSGSWPAIFQKPPKQSILHQRDFPMETDVLLPEMH